MDLTSFRALLFFILERKNHVSPERVYLVGYRFLVTKGYLPCETPGATRLFTLFRCARGESGSFPA